jgi:probable HAF family extracellular repeat protein
MHFPPASLVRPATVHPCGFFIPARGRARALACLWLLGAAALAGQPGYTVVDLGTLGGASSDAYGLNENGDVVGQAQTGTASSYHAFIYRDGMMRDLGTLPGGHFSVAYAIDSAGQAVGYSTSGSTAQRAVLFAGGTIAALAPLDPAFAGNDSAALAIDDTGRIIGYSKMPAPGGAGAVARAFLHANGLVSNLGMPPTAESDSMFDLTALGMTGSGLIFGRIVNTSSLELPARGWTYSAGAMNLLPLPSDPAYTATELADGNAGGSLVGTALSLAGGGPRPPERGFVFAAGNFTFIPPLDGDFGTNARGINSSGDVVGNSFDGLRNRAFLHTGGATHDLNALTALAGSGFASLDIARRINDRGQIIGVGTTVSGEQHAFLLTPAAAAATTLPDAPVGTASPQAVAITITDLVHIYDGSTRVAQISSNPSLPVHGDASGTLIVYYNDVTSYGLATGPGRAPYALYPSHPGDHTVRVEVYSNQQLYSGSATATLRILPAPVAVSLDNLEHVYDGAPKTVTVTTSPAIAVRPEGAGLEPMGIAITYDGSATPPSNPGEYTVAATVTSYGYTGNATGTLVIAAPAPPPPPIDPPATPPPPGSTTPPPPADDDPLDPTGRIEPARLTNVSARGRAGAGTDPLIAGFVIAGESPHRVLVRAIGPGLQAFGMADSVRTLRLGLFRGGDPIAQNQRWGLAANATELAAAMESVGAFPLSDGSADAAILTTLDPGIYTAVLTNADEVAGGALVEIYDASSGSSRLVNLSTRGGVGPGDHVLIAGVVVHGTAPKRILVRAVGPGLSAFGVPDALADPRLRIMTGSESLASNEGWNGNSDIAAAAAAAGAFPFAPGSADAALIVILPPGPHTAVVDSRSGASGTVLLEMYEAP